MISDKWAHSRGRVMELAMLAISPTSDRVEVADGACDISTSFDRPATFFVSMVSCGSCSGRSEQLRWQLGESRGR